MLINLVCLMAKPWSSQVLMIFVLLSFCSWDPYQLAQVPVIFPLTNLPSSSFAPFNHLPTPTVTDFSMLWVEERAIWKTSLIDSSTRSLLWIFIIQILIYESNTRTNLSLYFVISFPIRVKNFSRQEFIPVNIANHVKIQHLFFCSLKEYI